MMRMLMMRCDLWLAQPNTETMLRAALRLTGALVAVWALAVAVGVWSARSTVDREQTALTARSQQLSTLAGSMAGKRSDASRAGRVQTSSPEGPGSAEFAIELSALAQTAGAKLTGVRIGIADKAKTGPPVAAATGKGDDNWQQESFECSAEGQYTGLSRFLNGLAASRRVLEFQAIQVSPMGIGTSEPSLQLKLTGVVYGLAEKP